MTGCLEGSCSIQLSYGVKSGNKSVGVAGFEPTTSWSQTRRDTGLRYTPRNYGIKEAVKSLNEPLLRVIRLIAPKVRPKRGSLQTDLNYQRGRATLWRSHAGTCGPAFGRVPVSYRPGELSVG